MLYACRILCVCQADEDLYPEAYRKGDYIKGSNDQVPEPFRVARILKISTAASIKGRASPEDVKLTVQKFYRQVTLLYPMLVIAIF